MNRLCVSLQLSILTLYERGWSARRIARELGVHRETVGRELKRSKPANVTTGSESDAGAKPAKVTTGSEDGASSKPAKVTTGSAARGRSECEAWRPQIEQAVVQGLTARRIHQDLQAGHGYAGGYQSVKRFVRHLRNAAPLPFRRIETPAGEEMQVDFGQGAPVLEDGRRRRPHLFRVTLSFSRKGYSEVVWRQNTETFLRCLENAIRSFGGAPKTVVVDNLKAAVLQADWFDPEINPKLRSFALHYGLVILPTKPRTPQHKGKVEAGVKYVQNNALKGRTFTSLAEQNQFLLQWERRVADTRIHGTVRQQVAALFEQERPALQTLPADLFPSFHEAKRRVHRDGYVEYNRAYYSVPPETVGRDVWVRADSRLLHIYTLHMRQIAVHCLVEPGRFATDQTHVHPHKRNAIERGVQHLLERCRLIGRHSGIWAEQMYQTRGHEAVRVLQGLLHLARRHPVDQLEAAAEKAVRHACWRLRDLRRLMEHGDKVVQVDFLQEHALIRDLGAYRIDAFTHLP
jgi:transposase